LDLRTFVLQSNDQSSGLAAFLRASENSMPLTSPADSHQTSSISFERLETLISAGVCFHHAGLLSEERLLIEVPIILHCIWFVGVE
jgi:replicative superfamily II helicase